MKNYTVKKLRKSGAREVHVRPACPPLHENKRHGSGNRPSPGAALPPLLARFIGTARRIPPWQGYSIVRESSRISWTFITSMSGLNGFAMKWILLFRISA